MVRTANKIRLLPGFTLIELLVVIGIIGILAAVVLVAVNPGRQFASGRDTQRRANLYSITNAVYQYAAEKNGNLPTVITTTATNIGTDTGLVNLSSVLVPTYLSSTPKDPTTGTDGNTRYKISKDANSRLTVSADSELNPSTPITITR